MHFGGVSCVAVTPLPLPPPAADVEAPSLLDQVDGAVDYPPVPAAADGVKVGVVNAGVGVAGAGGGGASGSAPATVVSLVDQNESTFPSQQTSPAVPEQPLQNEIHEVGGVGWGDQYEGVLNFEP